MTFELGRVEMTRIKEYRNKRGISQAVLAQEVGVARQTVNLIENDKYNPSLDLCIKLAVVLETDLNTLFWQIDKGECADE